MDLGQLLRQRGPLAPADAVRIVDAVAAALEGPHRSNLVHGEVSPQTVHLDRPDGPVRLVAPNAGDRPGPWTAPDRDSPAGDVWSLGALLLTCLTGQPPYAVPLAQVSDQGLAQLVARSMTTHAAARPANASEFRALLPATPTGARQGRGRGRKVVALGAAAVLVLGALGTGGAVWATQSSDPEPPELRGWTTSTPAAPPRGIQGDLDGDGFGDVRALVSTPDHTKKVSTWLRSGSAFAAPTHDTLPGSVSTGLLCDLEGDGVDDVVGMGITDATEEREATFEVDLSSGPASNLPLTLPARPIRAERTSVRFSCGDFDGDRDDDLAFSYTTAQRTSPVWVVRVQDATFAEPESWLVRAGEPDAVVDMLVPGDFDGDGDDDLALVDGPKRGKDGWFRDGLGTLSLLTSGGSSFTAGDELPLPGKWWDHVELNAADLDGDLDDELFSARTTDEDRTLEVFTATSGRFGPSAVWATEKKAGLRHEYWDSVLTDVDGDGRADLVSVNLPTFEKERSRRSWPFNVRLSEGDGFGAAEPAMTVRCGRTCGFGDIELLDAHRSF